MPDVWLGRINRGIEKLFNIKGGPTLIDVNHQLTAEYSLQNGNEDRVLQSWFRFAAASAITGAAGQSAGVELHNPFGSNVIAVVERINVRISPATASLFILTYTSGPAAIADFGPVAATRLDGRINTGSTCIYSTTTAAIGFSTQIMFQAVNNGSTVDFIHTQNQELVLTPGSAFIVVDNTLAEAASFDIAWRERPLESSELT